MKRVRRTLVVGFVSVYLLIQVAIPAIGLQALYQDGDSGVIGHFGWQMFSHDDEDLPE